MEQVKDKDEIIKDLRAKEKLRIINYLKIGELKKLIKDLPDDYDVVMVSSDYDIGRHIVKANSVGILECEYEEHKALGLCSEEYSTICDETEYCEKLLFPKKED